MAAILEKSTPLIREIFQFKGQIQFRIAEI
jgi:hypothetical protein